MIAKINQLLEEVEALKAANAEELEALRIKYLSKKGAINDLMADFRNVAAEQKKEVGMRLNELKAKAQEKINALKEQFETQENGACELDLTRSAYPIEMGTRHPLSIVKNEIQRQAELALKESDKDEILKVADRKKEVQRRCAEADQQIERLQKELAAVQKYKKKTYENYVDGVLDKEEYLSYKAEYEKQDKDIRAKIQLAEQEKDSFGEAEESYENWIEKFIKYGTLSEVTREIVTELIEKIVVNGDKSIDIVFKYQSPYPVEKQAV